MNLDLSRDFQQSIKERHNSYSLLLVKCERKSWIKKAIGSIKEPELENLEHAKPDHTAKK